MRNVYLDNNATTPIHPEVLEALLPYYRERFGNASSVHAYGRQARAAVETGRAQVAALLNADPSEIIFTSGGSESDNFAIKSVALSRKDQGRHIITSQVEHPAVLETCQFLEKQGYEVTYLPVDDGGLVDVEDVRAAVRKDTILITVMHGNNEVGTIQPIAEIGLVAKEHGIVFHTDAVQSVGKTGIDLKELEVDLLSLSAHKIYGPKGIGAIYIRKGVELPTLITGGHQERGFRAGTENVAGIVALGKACELAMSNCESSIQHLATLRDRLQHGIMERVPNVRCNGHDVRRLPTTTNLSFEAIEGEALLINLDLVGIAVSTGSACSSGAVEPSHVLEAMRVPPEYIQGSIRFSVGRDNTVEDIDYVLEQLPPMVEKLRKMSPLWEG